MKLRLRELRKRANMSQADLASKVGVSMRSVGAWERQETQISLEDACLVSDALGCTPNDLCGWYIDHPRDSSQGIGKDEAEILGYYRESTQERKHLLMMTARDSAAMSKDATEHAASDVLKGA